MTCEPVAIKPATDHFNYRGDPNYVVVHVETPTFTPDLPCAGEDVSVFFPEYKDDDGNIIMSSKALAQWYRDVARLYCGECPIREHCAEYAIAHEEWGLWGGLSPADRKRERRARKWALVAREEVDRVFYPDRVYSHHTTTTDEEWEWSA